MAKTPVCKECGRYVSRHADSCKYTFKPMKTLYIQGTNSNQKEGRSINGKTQ